MTPVWLDDDEQRTWRAWLAVTRFLEETLDAQLQRDAGMAHGYYVVLAMLSEAPGRSLRMSDLAAVTHSSQSRLSHAVARLEERGWVRRERSTTDGRSSTAVLTDAGWTVLAGTAPGHVAEVRRRLFDAMTPRQVRQLEDICTAVLDRRRDDDPPVRPSAAGSSPS